MFGSSRIPSKHEVDAKSQPEIFDDEARNDLNMFAAKRRKRKIEEEEDGSGKNAHRRRLVSKKVVVATAGVAACIAGINAAITSSSLAAEVLRVSGTISFPLYDGNDRMVGGVAREKEPLSLNDRDDNPEFGVTRDVIVDDHKEEEATKEFVMWNNEEAYFNECRKHFLYNETWGKSLRPLVDKIRAKKIAAAWSPSVTIVPTLAFYDETNITELDYEAMQSLPQPYIIKPAHRYVPEMDA